MEEFGEAPMSPMAQYFYSSSITLTILGVLELEVPGDDSSAMHLLEHVFLPINPRFSSIVVTDEKMNQKWKKVEVNIPDHVHVPKFPAGMSVDYYDTCFNDYLTKIAMEQFPKNRPLWEIHLIKYPTKNAASNVVFKLHHSLGDGYSLMGALLSCLQRLDDPSLPLTFPSRQSSAAPPRETILHRLPRLFTGLFHTAYDFGWSLLKIGVLKDAKTPIRSAVEGVEFRPIVACTTTFSIDLLKQISSKLNVTINDVITGIITLGTRLYMQESKEGSEKLDSTVLVVLNTRAIRGYKSVSEMIKPKTGSPWGNRFSFLPVPIPKLTESEVNNPLAFVKEAHEMIKRQKSSASVYLNALLLSLMTKLRGHEATARFIHETCSSTSILTSNLIGPMEKVSLANHPCSGMYFVLAGNPQSLSMTMISYLGKLKIAITVEKGFIDQNRLKACIENAFDLIFKAALQS